MHFTLRQDDYKNRKTDSALDVLEGKIVISDWKYTPRLEDYFGKDDVEWNYEIQFSQLEKLNLALERITRDYGAPELDAKEREFHGQIQDEAVRATFVFLHAIQGPSTDGLA